MAAWYTHSNFTGDFLITRLHISQPGKVTTAIGRMKTGQQKLKEHEKSKDFFCMVSDAFRIAARRASIVLGSAWAFAVAVLIIFIWIGSGPAFHYSNTWQLIINTGTTIVTFLMVFLIQNTQNRDAKAAQLKLDEIIRAVEGARNQLVNLENLSDEELEKLERQFARIREKAQRGGGSNGIAPVVEVPKPR